MCPSETLAMLVSSTSMNVASVTVSAMTHGLTAGRVVAAIGGGGTAALMNRILRRWRVAQRVAWWVAGEEGIFHSRARRDRREKDGEEHRGGRESRENNE